MSAWTKISGQMLPSQEYSDEYHLDKDTWTNGTKTKIPWQMSSGRKCSEECYLDKNTLANGTRTKIPWQMLTRQKITGKCHLDKNTLTNVTWTKITRTCVSAPWSIFKELMNVTRTNFAWINVTVIAVTWSLFHHQSQFTIFQTFSMLPSTRFRWGSIIICVVVDPAQPQCVVIYYVPYLPVMFQQ